MSETVYYAIGDVHGMASKLARLHEAIVDDIAGRDAVIVHLGDYVDRGPESRRVIDLVRTLHVRVPANVRVLALLGNHEQLMLDAYRENDDERDDHWFVNGGEATVESYGARASDPDWRTRIDRAHIDWLANLPAIVREDRYVFVHAGIEPRTFPDCDDNVYLWTRSARFFETENWPERPELADIVVVHGHTPTESSYPDVVARRINVDTGAVYGGPLTAVVLEPGEDDPRFLLT